MHQLDLIKKSSCKKSLCITFHYTCVHFVDKEVILVKELSNHGNYMNWTRAKVCKFWTHPVLSSYSLEILSRHRYNSRIACSWRLSKCFLLRRYNSIWLSSRRIGFSYLCNPYQTVSWNASFIRCEHRISTQIWYVQKETKKQWHFLIINTHVSKK